MRSVVIALALVTAACSEPEPAVPVHSPVRVPDLVDIDVIEALRTATDAELEPKVERQGTGEGVDPDECPSAAVVDQEPRAGAEALRTSTVFLIVADC